MGDGCKCKVTTSWTETVTDGVIYADKIDETINPPKPTTKPAGATFGEWILGGVTLNNPKSFKFQEKKEIKIEFSNPNAIGCINTCGTPKTVKKDLPIESIKVIDKTFDQCIENNGYWIFNNPLIKGQVNITTIKATYQVKIKYTSTKYYLQHDHLCGGNCPPCNNLRNFDDTKSLEDEAKGLEPTTRRCN